jgi:ABC-2 type transport system ATP-binding protein|tara:strand:+ start:414 stop:1322 length:909 start_codon:yes stop_codon:yes gene_type:complete
MSIKVKNITKTYGKQKALNNISFEINTGEIVGFLGPNGAGKSTIMKIICSYITQNKGVVEVCGINVNNNPIGSKQKIGYLPENNPLYLDMYVKEFLAFIADIHKIKNKQSRIDEMIEITGLTPEKNKKISELSKGFRQRVGIASALIHDPEVLILDEPTTGLDPNQLKEIRNLIKQIGKTKTIMLSTHIMQEVEALCDRVIIIKQGEIVADSQIANLKASKEIILEVEFEKTIDKQLLKEIEQINKVEQIEGNKYKIHSDLDVRSEISQTAINQGNIVISMQITENKLEEIFQNLTKNDFSA